MCKQERTHRKPEELSESSLSERFRYGCPQGHVFEHVYVGESAYCYGCNCWYGWEEVVDREESGRWRPSWAREGE
jgi:hypothetical protein